MTSSRDSLILSDLQTNSSSHSSTTSLSSTDGPRSKHHSGDVHCMVTPSTILQLLLKSSGTFSDAPGNDEHLLQSIECASGQERMFALKAAESSKLLGACCNEIESWSWPGFDVPFEAQQDALYEEFEQSLNPIDVDKQTSFAATQEHLACLTKADVIQYSERLQMIEHQFSELDMNAQRNHVLLIHSQHKIAASINDYKALIGSTGPPSMNGLTALVTITILQALPYATRLSILLDTWSARLDVLQQLPALLHELRDTRKAFDDAWLVIGVRQSYTTGLRRERTIKVGKHGIFRESYERLRNQLEDKVALIGQRIDDMLDGLEGSQDALPQSWIDEVEGYEIDYGCWCVEAQNKVMQYEQRLDTTADASRQRPGALSARATSTDRQSKKSLRSQMPGAWRNSTGDDADTRPATSPIPRNGDQHKLDAVGLISSQPAPTRPLPPSKSPDRPSSSHADIVREHIRRVASLPGVKPSSRPQTPAKSQPAHEPPSVDAIPNVQHTTKPKTSPTTPNTIYSNTSTPKLPKEPFPILDNTSPTPPTALTETHPALRRPSLNNLRRVSFHSILQVPRNERPSSTYALQSSTYGFEGCKEYEIQSGTPAQLGWSEMPEAEMSAGIEPDVVRVLTPPPDRLGWRRRATGRVMFWRRWRRSWSVGEVA